MKNILAGLLGGLSGSALLLIFFIIASKIIQPVVLRGFLTGEESSWFLAVFLTMIFFTTLLASLITTFLATGNTRQFFHIIIGHIVIFLFLLPLYLIANYMQESYLAYIAALQIFLNVQFVLLIRERAARHHYAHLVPYYSSLLGILVAASLLGLLSQFIERESLIFLILPIVWLSAELFHEMLGKFSERWVNAEH